MKIDFKNKAIKLRKSGKTYSEILKSVPVAKSTLSEWLRSVGISKAQKSAFTKKKRLASLRGGLARRRQRIETFNRIVGQAESEVGKVSHRELWLIGTALYWAEGSKEKEYAPGSPVVFTNSDPAMISIFLRWLFEVCNISRERVYIELYVHDLYKSSVSEYQYYWSKITGLPLKSFEKVYFKNGNIRTKRRKNGQLYNGLLRVKVLRSSDLNRKIQGWTRGIIKS